MLINIKNNETTTKQFVHYEDPLLSGMSCRNYWIMDVQSIGSVFAFCIAFSQQFEKLVAKRIGRDEKIFRFRILSWYVIFRNVFDFQFFWAQMVNKNFQGFCAAFACNFEHCNSAFETTDTKKFWWILSFLILCFYAWFCLSLIVSYFSSTLFSCFVCF